MIETGKVTNADVDDVTSVFESEFTMDIERRFTIFQRVAEQLTHDMGPDQINEILLTQNEFQKNAKQMGESIRAFAQAIYESRDRTAEGITSLAVIFFKVEEKNDKIRQAIDRVRQSVLDEQKKTRIEEEMRKSGTT